MFLRRVGAVGALVLMRTHVLAKAPDVYIEIEVPGGSHASAGRENIGRVFEFLSRHGR